MSSPSLECWRRGCKMTCWGRSNWMSTQHYKEIKRRNSLISPAPNLLVIFLWYHYLQSKELTVTFLVVQVWWQWIPSVSIIWKYLYFTFTLERYFLQDKNSSLTGFFFCQCFKDVSLYAFLLGFWGETVIIQIVVECDKSFSQQLWFYNFLFVFGFQLFEHNVPRNSFLQIYLV